MAAFPMSTSIEFLLKIGFAAQQSGRVTSQTGHPSIPWVAVQLNSEFVPRAKGKRVISPPPTVTGAAAPNTVGDKALRLGVCPVAARKGEIIAAAVSPHNRTTRPAAFSAWDGPPPAHQKRGLSSTSSH